MKRILITGEGSYIGEAVRSWLLRYEDKRYDVETLDMRGDDWKQASFDAYDVIFHTAGIVHRKEKRTQAEIYYQVNFQKTVQTAEKARKEGVKQFIYLSSMSVYGIQQGAITKDTPLCPKNHYGSSKLQAERGLQRLENETFKVAILRPPMVYGAQCPGNYGTLARFAKSCPVFPQVSNQRSMLYVGNLAKFVEFIIEEEKRGVFCPHNKEYVCTSKLVYDIGKLSGHAIRMSKGFGRIVKSLSLPVTVKVFGDLYYEQGDTLPEFMEYEETLRMTEERAEEDEREHCEIDIKKIQKKQLEILVYFRDFCRENHLHFVLAGGTCLGAVRHHGFIPWDDDVDVFMMREDYEKLCRLWDKKADTSRYSCVRSCKEYNIHHTAAEIKDNHTTFINRHSMGLDIHQGIMIDVIPLDGVPEGFIRRFFQMIDSMMYCCFNFQRLPEHKSKAVYIMTKIALSCIRSPRLRYHIWKGAEKRLARYGTKNSRYVASLGEGMTIMRQYLKKEWIADAVEMEFEGYQMPVPSGYDEFLTISYGDYKKLPPENERVCRHDIVFMDLEHSYQRYKGKKYLIQ